MDHDQIAELNKRLAAMQRTLARTHNTIIFGAAGSMVTGAMSVIAVAHFLEWPKWPTVVTAIVLAGALNLFAARTLKKDGLDEF
jgi:hypothetical protein